MDGTQRVEQPVEALPADEVPNETHERSRPEAKGRAGLLSVQRTKQCRVHSVLHDHDSRRAHAEPLDDDVAKAWRHGDDRRGASQETRSNRRLDASRGSHLNRSALHRGFLLGDAVALDDKGPSGKNGNRPSDLRRKATLVDDIGPEGSSNLPDMGKDREVSRIWPNADVDPRLYDTIQGRTHDQVDAVSRAGDGGCEISGVNGISTVCSQIHIEREEEDSHPVSSR